MGWRRNSRWVSLPIVIRMGSHDRQSDDSVRVWIRKYMDKRVIGGFLIHMLLRRSREHLWLVLLVTAASDIRLCRESQVKSPAEHIRIGRRG